MKEFARAAWKTAAPLLVITGLGTAVVLVSYGLGALAALYVHSAIY